MLVAASVFSSTFLTMIAAYREWLDARESNSAEYQKFRRWQEFEEFRRWQEQKTQQ